MKRKYYILGLLAALCLLGTGYYAWTLYDAHRKQVAEWNESAKAAFEEALWMEVNKRADIPFFYSSKSKEGKTTVNDAFQDTIFITSPWGRRGYYIDPVRYERSLVKDADKRVMLGALLYEYPLSVDTLAMHWNANLSNRKIPSQRMIRYIYTDWDLHNDTTYSVFEGGLDSLTVNYLGFRCEHELTAFVSYPHWLSGLTYGEKCILLLPWILYVLLFVCYPKLEVLAKRKLIHKEVIEKTIEVEKTVIVEKEIHVADVSIDKAQVYELPGGGLFDSFSGTVTKGDFVHTLPPQPALLLRLFLRKNNHHLSTAEIEQELWNGNGSTDKIHKVIQRLRVELKKVSPDLVIKNVNGDYELK